MNVDDAWSTYRATGDITARNQIIEHYLPMVERVALRLGPFLAKHAEHDDLVSYGTLGLIDAVAKFDPATSGNFRGFAWKRIKGEIFDQLRRADTVRRKLRMHGKRIENARAELTARLRRSPTDREVAEELGLSLDQLRVQMADLAVGERPVPLTATTSSGMAIADLIAADDDVEQTHEIENLREVIVIAWNSLPRREQTMLALRYVEGLTLTEAGDVLGIAASRVSQLHGDALRLLRSSISRL